MIKNEDGNALLTTGMKSYPQALAAIRYFRQLLVERCRDAFFREMEGIQAAMGVSFDREDIQVRRRPDRIESGPDLGSRAIDVGVCVKKADWKLYNNVSWEQRDVADSEFEAGIWISLVTAKPAPIIVDKLMSAHPNPQYRLEVEGSDEVCLGRSLHAEEVGMLDDLLRDLDGEWARLWREIGGLKQFLDLPVNA